MPAAASSAAAREADRDATRFGMPPAMGSIGSGMPIRPVEQTRTCSAGTPRPAAASAHISSASARPRRPVAALALPLLTTTADAQPPLAARWSRLTWTGAAAARLEVKVAAVGTGGAVVGGQQGQVEGPGGLDARRQPRRPRIPAGVVMLTGTPPPWEARSPREARGPGWRTGPPDPTAPLTRLSMAPKARTHPVRGSTRAVTWAQLEPLVALVDGRLVGDHHEGLVPVVGLVRGRPGRRRW